MHLQPRKFRQLIAEIDALYADDSILPNTKQRRALELWPYLDGHREWAEDLRFIAAIEKLCAMGVPA